ncbi:MAG: PACE efflux transporter [Photobacterium frigidiphilum]|uniref:PACE efflux transporter n=1 Tax=Photobacterium frigidiphilum TaxID=264736 RepID=UPI003002CE65
MSFKERIFHSVLFEIIALLCFMVAASFVTKADTKSVAGLAIGLSMIAMTWNYIYNLVFDRVFGENRVSRGLKMRIGHGLGFELGLVFVSFPLMMWVLQLDFWTVFIMDAGVVIFFLVYAIVYNWCYDTIRLRFIPTVAIS